MFSHHNFQTLGQIRFLIHECSEQHSTGLDFRHVVVVNEAAEGARNISVTFSKKSNHWQGISQSVAEKARVVVGLSQVPTEEQSIALGSEVD